MFAPHVHALERQYILQELVKAGADINESGGMSPNLNALMLAILMQNLKLCKFLVSLGADVNHLYRANQQCDPKAFFLHETHLSRAVVSGPEFVTFLLQNGAQLTDCDDKICTWSALHNALIISKPDVLIIFMDLYEKSKRSFSWNKAITMAMKYAYQDNITAILHREYHLNESLDPVFGYFHLAASNGLTSVMHLLLEQQPQALQADWLINNNIPQALQEEKHRDFLTWLKDIRSQPLQLQLICRNTILRQLRPGPEEKIDQLVTAKQNEEIFEVERRTNDMF